MTELTRSSPAHEARRETDSRASTYRPIPHEALEPGVIISLLPPDWPSAPDLYEIMASSRHFAVLQPIGKRRDGSPSAPISISVDREFYQARHASGN